MANSFKNSERNFRGAVGLSPVDLKLKMDALVSDLTHALDESQLSQYHRKRRGLKRRSKISNSIVIPHCTRVASDDSSSSIGEVVLSQDNKSSIPLSESDDLSPPPDLRMRVPHLVHHRLPANLAESDSLNENFSPTTHNKRIQLVGTDSSSVHSHAEDQERISRCFILSLFKRENNISPREKQKKGINEGTNERKPKCKRMALDPDAPSTSMERSSFHSSFRKKKSLKPTPESENKFIDVSAGKRKRGRDRSVDIESSGNRSRNRNRHGNAYHSLRLSQAQASQLSNEEYMDLEYPNQSNTSESSSESEAGIWTCDEGREADDEQSDWFAEPGAVYGVPGAESSARIYNGGEKRLVWWNEDNISPSAKAMFKEKYERMSQESHQACRLRFQKLRERLLRREIRAGRRRLQERRPGFSIISSVNDKVSRFLQDPGQSELKLKPMTDRDRDQLCHLAKLYSLNLRNSDDLTAPILTKTRNTITTTQLEASGLNESNFPGAVPVPLSDLKRRRRTPPPSVHNLTEGSNDSLESVIANNSAGSSSRPPVPTVSWGDDDVGDCCADSLSERLADSEPDPVPSPTSIGLHDCTL